MGPTADLLIDRIPTTGTLTDRVFKALAQLIASEGFQAGTRLPSEQKMAASFGVSKTVIREALSRLKSEGVVESRQGIGVYVRTRNMDAPFRIDRESMGSICSVLQVFELRLSLEGEVASLAAQRRTRQQLAAIKRAENAVQRDFLAQGNSIEADIAFHRSIAVATGNPHFLALTEFLFNCLFKATRMIVSHEESKGTLSRQSSGEHLRIVEAIAQADAAAAREAAREHIEAARNRLVLLDREISMV